MALAAIATTDGTSDTTTTITSGTATTGWTPNPPYNGANFTLLRPVQLFDFLYIAPQLPAATSGGMGRPSNGVDYLKAGGTLFPIAALSVHPVLYPAEQLNHGREI